MPDPKVEQAMTGIVRLLSPGRHPDSERLQRESLEWFDRQDFTEISPECTKRLRRSRIGVGVGAAFPSVDYAAAFWWSRFSFFYMVVDDFYAEGRAALDVPRFLLDAGGLWHVSHHTLPIEVPEDPFGAVLQGLFRELDDLVAVPVAVRIRQAFRDYLFAAGWEAAIRASGQVPPVNEYSAFRRHFTQFVLNLEFVECSPGALLLEEERRDPQIQRTRAFACDVMAGINDLCSIEFEVAHNNVALPVLAGSNADERSFEGMVELCRARIATFIEGTKSLGGRPNLLSYGEAITQWVAGAAWWHGQALGHRYLVEHE